MKIERAEAGTRSCMTASDKAQYTGLARHPLARKWMLARLIEAREKMEAAETEEAGMRWAAEVERVSGELRRCGLDMDAST
ncbi:hypothetical protein [Marinobacter qingdaonensis]|uniref:Uncharacterized protein n=1 Tax=Marinobacter qingdaonensis TaxID=3108486 RepID=A0ABU5P1U9_9GAMM|nr:hypothetical protein [Marinobacter sp. ASW11-75]MEA1081972.1 hypothetical protein [Marinobacter sp. ASW11-75]